MTRTSSVSDLSNAQLEMFSNIIDVRSPSEFEEDHLPGAINLPVLYDNERSEVGTLYTQVSQFQARRLGAEYVSRNISSHLSNTLCTMPETYKPLIYCWRGGMRSNSMATVLNAVGWRCGVVDGGYKTWRKQVISGLIESTRSLKLVLLDGRTGSGKSRLIDSLKQRGLQTIDLEGIANHRGSAFGAYPESKQPSQKLFETRLYSALAELDMTQPIFVEGESRLIGRCALPQHFFDAMQRARWIELRASLEARVEHLVRDYSDWCVSTPRLKTAIERLRPRHKRELVEHWLQLAEGSEHKKLACSLMCEHYDPMYDRHLKRRKGEQIAVIEVSEAGSKDCSPATDRIVQALSQSEQTRSAIG